MNKLFLFSLFFSFNLFAQDSIKEIMRFKAIENIVTGYNEQDYKMMKSSFGLVGKVIVSKKRLRNEYENFFFTNGIAQIDTITKLYTNVYTVELKMTNDNKKRIFWQVNFDTGTKVNGFGFGYPSFYYKKNDFLVHNQYALNGLEAQLDEILSRYNQEESFNGFCGSLLVSLSDTFVYKRSAGYRLESQSLVNDNNTLFHLASCTKPITAMAIALLVDKGLIQFNDKVNKYVSEFPYKEVTIKNLLSHTSGIPDYQIYIDKYLKDKHFVTNEDILAVYNQYQIPINFVANSRFQYSNTNFVFLAILLERVTGQKFGDFVQTEIFEPLGMDRSKLYNSRRTKLEFLDNYAHGYVYSNELNKYCIPDSLKEYNYVIKQDPIYGDDNISSTTGDYSKFLSVFSKGNSIISDTLIEEMTSPHQLNDGKFSRYGLGLMVNDIANCYKLIYHTGSWPGYYTLVLTIPEIKLNFVILTNNEYNFFQHLADEIIYTVLKRI